MQTWVCHISIARACRPAKCIKAPRHADRLWLQRFLGLCAPRIPRRRAAHPTSRPPNPNPNTPTAPPSPGSPPWTEPRCRPSAAVPRAQCVPAAGGAARVPPFWTPPPPPAAPRFARAAQPPCASGAAASAQVAGPGTGPGGADGMGAGVPHACCKLCRQHKPGLCAKQRWRGRAAGELNAGQRWSRSDRPATWRAHVCSRRLRRAASQA